MATLNLSYDTGNVPLSRIVDAFAARYSYQPLVPDPNNPGTPDNPGTMPNPESKAQFANRMIRRFIIDVVRDIDSRNAQAAIADIPLT